MLTLWRLGFVQPGYDADLVVWDRHPMRVGATPLEVYINGNSVVRASDDLWHKSETTPYSKEAPPSRPSVEGENSCHVGQSDIVIRGIKKSFVGNDGLRGGEIRGDNLTAVIRSGNVVCIGENSCEDATRAAADDSVPFIDTNYGYVVPV